LERQRLFLLNVTTIISMPQYIYYICTYMYFQQKYARMWISYTEIFIRKENKLCD
jgi:hypothetical protein